MMYASLQVEVQDEVMAVFVSMQHVCTPNLKKLTLLKENTVDITYYAINNVLTHVYARFMQCCAKISEHDIKTALCISCIVLATYTYG